MIGRLRVHLESWCAAWRVCCGKLAPMCRFCDSVHVRSKWRRMRRRSRGVRMHGARYCRTECLELALHEVLTRARPMSHRAAIAPHRIPLGLLLLSAPATYRRTTSRRARSATGSGLWPEPEHNPENHEDWSVAAGTRLRHRTTSHGRSGATMVLPGFANWPCRNERQPASSHFFWHPSAAARIFPNDAGRIGRGHGNSSHCLQ